MSKLKISEKKLYCNTCRRKTNHFLKAEHTKIEYELENEGTPNEYPIFDETWIYRFWVCKGCDTAIIEEAYKGPGYTDVNGKEFYDYSYYPKRKTRELSKKRFNSLDKNLYKVYTEAIECYNNNLPISCALSLRSLIEGICINKGITDKVSWGLENKINKLKDKTHLPHNIVDGLLSFKFMGDDAAHRLKTSAMQELKLAIEVIEDLLNFLYELNYRLEHKTKTLAQKVSGTTKKKK